jgi:hypothetical protein
MLRSVNQYGVTPAVATQRGCCHLLSASTVEFWHNQPICCHHLLCAEIGICLQDLTTDVMSSTPALSIKLLTSYGVQSVVQVGDLPANVDGITARVLTYCDKSSSVLISTMCRWPRGRNTRCASLGSTQRLGSRVSWALLSASLSLPTQLCWCAHHQTAGSRLCSGTPPALVSDVAHYKGRVSQVVTSNTTMSWTIHVMSVIRSAWCL